MLIFKSSPPELLLEVQAVQKCDGGTDRTFKHASAGTPVNLSSSLTSLLEFRLSLKAFMSADLSDRRSQRGDSGTTPGMLQDGGRAQFHSFIFPG